MARTIQSPGVEINEIDLTLRADTVVGTNVFIAGFAAQGPIDEVLQPTSISEFEQIYGTPTNSAERYFYHSVKGAMNSSPAKVTVTRLPYGADKGEGFSSWKYSALAYPVASKYAYNLYLSAYEMTSVVVTNSGSGYVTMPSIVSNAPGQTGTVLRGITADDGLGQDTFGIQSIDIVFGGDSFSQPTIDIGKSFQITNVLIVDGGSGYLDEPTIEIVGTNTRVASARAVMIDDGIGTFVISGTTILSENSGSGYSVAPTVVVTGDNITPASFTVNLGNDGTGTFGVTSLNLINAGLGYITAPTITFVGATTGVQPDATPDGATATTYKIDSINILDYGLGYAVEPSVNVTGAVRARLASENDAVLSVDGNDTTAFAVAIGTQSFSESIESSLNGEADPGLQGGLDVLPSSNYTFDYLGKTCYIGKPTHIELSPEEYESIKQGNINWTNNPTLSTQNFSFNTLGNAGLIVLNKAQTSINNKFEGYYVGAIDNSNYNPATDFDGIQSINGINENVVATKNYISLPTSRMSFALSAGKTGDGSSVSEVMENLSNYDLADESFNDTFALAIFKLRQNLNSGNSIQMSYGLTESHTGSIDYNREIGDSNGGPSKTFSIEKVTNAASSNVEVMVNPFLSDRYLDSGLDVNGNPTKRVRFLSNRLSIPLVSPGFQDNDLTYAKRVGSTQSTILDLIADYGRVDALFPLGIYTNTATVEREIGALPQKLERAFELVENADVFPIDLSPEAGLGTIYVNAIEQSGGAYLSAGKYSDSTPLNAISACFITNFEGLNDEANRIISNYLAVANVFILAAEKQRKDFLVILDPIRNIFVQGDNSKVLNTKKIWSPNAGVDPDPLDANYSATNFSQHMYWPLRHQFGKINCSYATTYSNWVQVFDSSSSRQMWIPFSGVAAGIMANTDANFQPWYAPAGFTRGVVAGVNDLALYPKQKQRDQLYKISMNPIAFFPNEGFVVFGQKTLLKKPSAFDRINVRRLFLNLEKATKNTAKFFVFEPNTLFTRTQVINILAPIFENAKNTEGLYDYRIVCDERNNTPDVIDNNELKIDIYIQPVRTAEFILVNFYATRTGTNFDELIGK